MFNAKSLKALVVMLAMTSLTIRPTVAHADVIGAEAYLAGMDRQAALDRIGAVLAREELRQEFERLGIDPVAAEERVTALNNQELLVLAENLEELPAGGGVLGTIGIVFIVLLILELTGVIDIFKKI